MKATDDLSLDPQRRVRAEEVGARIAAARLARGMSQVKLAGVADIDPSYLSKVENGNSMASIDVIDRLCRALSRGKSIVTLDHIVYGKPLPQ